MGRWTCTYSISSPEHSLQLIANSLCNAQSEEAPSALLLAHAASLSLHRGCKRRSALLYAMAGYRLEKCGNVRLGLIKGVDEADRNRLRNR